MIRRLLDAMFPPRPLTVGGDPVVPYAGPVEEPPLPDDVLAYQRGVEADRLHAAGLDEVAAELAAQARAAAARRVGEAAIRPRPSTTLLVDGQKTQAADRPSAYAALVARMARRSERQDLGVPSTQLPAPACRPGSAVGMCRYPDGGR